MKLIIIDGGPASGKNTLGGLLVNKFIKHSEKAKLLDLDTYVEKLNPTWIWKDKKREEHDQQQARVNCAKDIDKYLQEDFNIISIGERILTENDLSIFRNRLTTKNCHIYLYHLTVPPNIRKKRLTERGPHSLINLEKDEKERNSVKEWLGYIYKNINSQEKDSENLFKLILNKEGLVL